MLEAFLSILGSSAVGCIIGGIFALLNRKADAEAKKADQDHERAKWSHDLEVKSRDLEIVKAEAQGRKDVAVIEAGAAVDVAQLNAIAQVQVAERVTPDEITAAGKLGWMYVIVSVFIKSIRPTLTVAVGFTALVVNVYLLKLMSENWNQFSTDTWFQFGQMALMWVTGQASMMFSYWFVARGTGK